MVAVDIGKLVLPLSVNSQNGGADHRNIHTSIGTAPASWLCGVQSLQTVKRPMWLNIQQLAPPRPAGSVVSNPCKLSRDQCG